MNSKDQFAELVFEPLDEALKPWVLKTNMLMLWLVASPDGKDIVIFNDDHLERGCMQVKANGRILAAWRDNPWGDIDEVAAQEVLDFLATGQFQ